MDLINLTKIPSDEILSGLFGIEWEALRVKRDGKLSLTPHPEVFGDKLKNPVVTTDFSESQIEIIIINLPSFSLGTIQKKYYRVSCIRIFSRNIMI